MNSFHEVLREAGYTPPPILHDDGNFQRFGPKNAHWLVHDGIFGAAGDWRGTMPRVRWHKSGNQALTPAEKYRLREQVQAAHAAYLSDKQDREVEAAETARTIFENAQDQGQSAYLQRKQVPAIGIRFSMEPKSGKPFLALPMQDDENRLWSLQKIYGDGTKLFIKGGRKHGCFHVIGDVAHGGTLLFCEGYATGASIHLATKQTVIVCFDAGNLAPVIATFKGNYPMKTMVIAADNDAYGVINTGKEKAQAASAQYGCPIALPTFKDVSQKPTDFNDLHILEGLDMVREQLMNIPKARGHSFVAPTNAQNWPEPDLSLLDTEHAPPPFDFDALTPAWANWAKEQAEAVGAPVDYVVGALITNASALIGNARRVAASQDWIEPPHLWIAEIGAPSTGKTPAQKVFIEVCKTLEREDRPAWETKRAEYEQQAETAKAKQDKWKEDIKKAIKSGATLPDRPNDAVMPDAPVMPRIVIIDSTIEETTNIMSGNPKGLFLVRDELSGWIGSFDRYGGEGSDRAFFLECWNGGSHTVDRVKKSGQPVEVAHASLAILGGIQPDKLRETFSGADDGFAARFVYIWPTPAPFIPLDTLKSHDSTGRMDFLLTAFRRLHNLKMEQWPDSSSKPKIIPLQRTRLFDEIRREAMDKARSTHGLAAGWHGKTPGRALRYALTIELLAWACSDQTEEPTMISENSIACAGTFLDYAEQMFNRAVGGLGVSQQEADAALIARHIIKSKLANLNERSLYQTTGFAHLRNTQRRKEAMSCLEKLGWIKTASKESKGRPRGDWLVNPKLGATA